MNHCAMTALKTIDETLSRAEGNLMLKRILMHTAIWGLPLILVAPSQAQVAPSPDQVQRYSGLLAAAQTGDVVQLKTLLAKQPPVDLRDPQQRTPLHVATYARQRGVIRLLAEIQFLYSQEKDRSKNPFQEKYRWIQAFLRIKPEKYKKLNPSELD